MKLSVALLFTMGLSLSFPKCIRYNEQDCRNFQLQEINTDEVEKFLTISTSENTPKGLEDFHGLWYMNGNPLADELVSVAGTKYDAKEDAYFLRVYDEKIWTWSPNLAGRTLYSAVRQTGLTYKFKKQDPNTYQVTPLVFLPEYLLGVELSIPELLADFEIVRTEDPDLWMRPSKFFGQDVGAYRFMRIVYANGTRTSKYYSNYLPNINSKEDGITLLPTQLMAVEKK
jgi:hypothetical protein